jgi:hypothetical protein
VSILGKKIRMVELQKFESLGWCISKIETLKVELKMLQTLRRVKYNFSNFFFFFFGLGLGKTSVP